MIWVIVAVTTACLEEFYLLFLLGAEKAKSRSAQAAFYVLLSAAAALMSYFGIPAPYNTVIYFCMIVVIGGYSYDAGRIKLGFYAVIYILIAYVSEVITLMAVWLFSGKPVTSDNVRIFLIMVNEVFRFFLIYLFKKLIYAQKKHSGGHEFFPVLLSGISFIVVLAVMNANIMYIPDSQDKIFLLAGDAAVLLAFILNIIFTEKYVEVKALSEAEKRKMAQMELQYQYYERKMEDMHYIRQIYHDLKNHLLLLDDEAVSHQIMSRIKSVEDYYETGNDFLDVIIYDKMRKASENNIHLECDIEFMQGGFLHPLDISTIFGNLLDNAIEAAGKLDMDEKYIFCRAKQKRSLFIILVQNHYAPEQSCIQGRDYKKKPYMHGFGLKNVQDAVRKYGGECCVEKETDLFRVSIVFPIPGSKMNIRK